MVPEGPGGEDWLPREPLGIPLPPPALGQLSHGPGSPREFRPVLSRREQIVPSLFVCVWGGEMRASLGC